jgi:hypothetical protein
MLRKKSAIIMMDIRFCNDDCKVAFGYETKLKGGGTSNGRHQERLSG